MKKVLYLLALVSAAMQAGVNVQLEARIGQESMTESFVLDNEKNICFLSHDSGVMTTFELKEQTKEAAVFQIIVMIVVEETTYEISNTMVTFPLGQKTNLVCPSPEVDAEVALTVTEAA